MPRPLATSLVLASLCLAFCPYPSRAAEPLIPHAETVLEKYRVALADLQETDNDEDSDTTKRDKKLVASFSLADVRFGQYAFNQFDLLSAGPKRRGVKPVVFLLDPEIWTYYHEGMDRLRNPEAYFGVGQRTDVQPDFESTPQTLPIQEPQAGASGSQQTLQQVNEIQAVRSSSLENLRSILPDTQSRYLTQRAYLNYYAWKSPIGSQLLKRGYKLVYPHPRYMANLRDISIPDWGAYIREVAKNKDIDPESLFIVATREFADLGFKIALAADLNALVVEEPSVPINSSSVKGTWPPAEDSDPWAVLEENSRFAYHSILASINEDILLIRDRTSPFFLVNNQTLVESFLSARKNFLVNLLDASPRTAEIPLSEFPLERFKPELTQDELAPYHFEYDNASMSKWTERMLTYLADHTKVDPIPLPDITWDNERPTYRPNSDSGILNRIPTPTSSSSTNAAPPNGGR